MIVAGDGHVHLFASWTRSLPCSCYLSGLLWLSTKDNPVSAPRHSWSVANMEFNTLSISVIYTKSSAGIWHSYAGRTLLSGF